MASPIGHAAVGVAAAAVIAQGTGTPASISLWTGAVIASGLPDLDVLYRLFGRKGPRYHRGWTHSLIVVACVIALWLATTGWFFGGLAPGLTLAWIGALVSHPLLDVVTTGPTLARLGWGIPLFWPLSRRRFFVRWPLLVGDRGESDSFTDTMREMREDALRFVPLSLLVIVLARWLG